MLPSRAYWWLLTPFKQFTSLSNPRHSMTNAHRCQQKFCVRNDQNLLLLDAVS